MQQADTVQIAPDALSWFTRIIRLLGGPEHSAPQHELDLSGIDWTDSDFELAPGPDQPVCGGYNEAFIVQHWTSYHLR